MRLRAIFFLLTTIILTGCQAGIPHNYEQPTAPNMAILKTTVGSLNIDHPDLDLDKNTGIKDFRFICVCGFVCHTPGVEKDDVMLTKKYGVRCLEGTSDAIESDEHGKLIQTARKYAEAYNILLMKKVK